MNGVAPRLEYMPVSVPLAHMQLEDRVARAAQCSTFVEQYQGIYQEQEKAKAKRNQLRTEHHRVRSELATANVQLDDAARSIQFLTELANQGKKNAAIIMRNSLSRWFRTEQERVMQRCVRYIQSRTAAAREAHSTNLVTQAQQSVAMHTLMACLRRWTVVQTAMLLSRWHSAVAQHGVLESQSVRLGSELRRAKAAGAASLTALVLKKLREYHVSGAAERSH